ncbi:hypothetical protein ACLEB0_01895 [Klebsiella pneumoniae]
MSAHGNYDLARRLNLTPMGTQAHEWLQAHQQISPSLASSQRAALAAWLEEYPDQAWRRPITDCITIGWFPAAISVQELPPAINGCATIPATRWNRGEKAIAHYQKLGIDPLSKVLVFSDNLDLAKAVDLYRHFASRGGSAPV